MALKDTWTDKVNNVDNVDAEDINSIARTVIALETALGSVPIVTTADDGKILRVVGGKWSVETLINAEEVSY